LGISGGKAGHRILAGRNVFAEKNETFFIGGRKSWMGERHFKNLKKRGNMVKYLYKKSGNTYNKQNRKRGNAYGRYYV
jgi:hypothetical protein